MLWIYEFPKDNLIKGNHLFIRNLLKDALTKHLAFSEKKHIGKMRNF